MLPPEASPATRRSFKRALGPALLALLLAGGCVQSVPQPPPPPAGGAQHASPVPPSTLDVPVEVDLALVKNLLEKEVPKEVVHENSWDRSGHTGLRYRFERGPIDVSFHGGELQVRTEVRYRARACVGIGPICQPVASCGYDKDGMRELDVTLSSPVSLSPKWELQTRVRERHEFVDPCKVSFLRVDIRDQLDRLLTRKIAPLLPEVDAKLAQAANVRKRANDAWKLLAKPIEVHPGVWLDLAPEEARVSKATGSGGKVRFVLGVTGRPRLLAGEKPQGEAPPLPRLARARRPSGFHLYIQAQVPYEEATRLLRKELVGQRFDAGGHRTVVRDVALTGGPGGAALKVDLETVRGFFRKVRGTVYVVGRPSWDAAHGVLSLEDLDYSVDSKDLPVQVADLFLRPDLLDLLRENARWNLGTRVEEARELASKALDRELAPGIRLRGTLAKLEPLEVVAEQDRFVVSAAASGKSSLAIGSRALAKR